MRIALFLLLYLNLAPSIIVGQYSYFNNFYLGADWENDNGLLYSNLLIRGDTTVVHGISYVDGSFIKHLKEIDLNGEDISNFEENLPPNIYHYIGSEESFNSCANLDFVWAGTQSSANYFSGKCTRYNDELVPIWSRDLTWASNDSTESVLYFAQELSNGDIFAAGRWTHFLPPNENKLYPYIEGLLLCRYSAEGDSIYEKIIPFWEDDFSYWTEYAVAVNQAFELANGEIILSGILQNGLDIETEIAPFFVKITSQGDYIDHFRFGSNCENWYPRCTVRTDGKIIFAYDHCVLPGDEGSFNPVWQIRSGLFDPLVMDTLWTTQYEHEHQGLGVMDIEATPDGGFIIQCNVPIGPFDEEEAIVPVPDAGAYLMKIDSVGIELWYKHVTPPIPFDIPYSNIECHGIEITELGDILAVGTFWPEGENFMAGWLFKTDCMGNTELPAISFQPSISQTEATVSCFGGSNNVFDLTWNFGDETIVQQDSTTHTYSESGTYSISLSGTYCAMSFDTTFNVTIDIPELDCMGNIETPPLAINPSTTAINDSTYLFVSAPENLINIVWDFGDSNFFEGSSATHSYLSSGVFTVEVCGEYCDSLYCETFTVTSTVGLEEILHTSINTLLISPNPIRNNRVNIQSSSIIESIRVLDMTGKVIHTQKANSTNIEVSVPGLAAGSYLVECQFENGERISELVMVGERE